jgi:hypothetical protein
MNGEEPSLFHIIKMAKRRETREIRHVHDQDGNIVTRQKDISIAFLRTYARNTNSSKKTMQV